MPIPNQRENQIWVGWCTAIWTETNSNCDCLRLHCWCDIKPVHTAIHRTVTQRIYTSAHPHLLLVHGTHTGWYPVLHMPATEQGRPCLGGLDTCKGKTAASKTQA